MKLMHVHGDRVKSNYFSTWFWDILWFNRISYVDYCFIYKFYIFPACHLVFEPRFYWFIDLRLFYNSLLNFLSFIYFRNIAEVITAVQYLVSSSMDEVVNTNLQKLKTHIWLNFVLFQLTQLSIVFIWLFSALKFFLWYNLLYTPTSTCILLEWVNVI